jgi:UDPglucose 6-dehydrogenase
MDITVIGAGYVGQVVTACLASFDHTVTVYDIDHDKLDSLEQGKPTIHEPGLDSLVKQGRQKETLIPEADLSEATTDADAVFLCVGTPPSQDGSVNLDYHYAAVDELKPFVDDTPVIIKSTVPPGTADQTRQRLDTAVYNNPEFLKEGSAVQDFLQPDRVVIGGQNERRAEDLATKVYHNIVDDAELYVTDNASAELIKYASNAFLATKISYANELARLCDEVGADIDDVTTGMALDDRIKDAFFGAGAGYGGSCFPKDTKALIEHAKSLGEDMHIVQATEDVNHEQRQRIINAVEQRLDSVDDATIGVLGTAFKPDTDDIRGSPAIDIVEHFQSQAGLVKVHDPQALANFKDRIGDRNVAYEDTPREAATNTDAVIVLTAWDDYKDLDIDTLNTGYVYDARNIYTDNDYHTDVQHVGKP